MTRPSWVAPQAWLSFIELDKSVVLVWLDWLVFCEYGFSVSALWCRLATPTILLGFLLSSAWGISSQLLHQSTAAAPYLGREVSPHCCLFWPSTLDGSSRPFCAHTATTLKIVQWVVKMKWKPRSLGMRNQETKRSGYKNIIYVNFEIVKFMTNIGQESNIGIQVLKSKTLSEWGIKYLVSCISTYFVTLLYLLICFCINLTPLTSVWVICIAFHI